MTNHEPHNVAGDDREPHSELADLVHAMLGRRVRDLRVEFDGRGLVLRGRAESYHAKQLAQHVAMVAVGLPLSANKIVVTYHHGGSLRPGGTDALAAVPTPHTAESVPHATRGTQTPDDAGAAPGDNHPTGGSA